MNISSVLVIDDSEGDQLLTAMAIKGLKPDIKIIKAYDGQEALNILETTQSRPDLILLDINMPGMDGMEFLEKYNENNDASSVVVMLSSSNQGSDKEKTLAYPCVKAYFIKPIDEKDLEFLKEL